MLLGFFLVWYSFSKTDLNTLTSYLKEASYLWVLLGLFLGVLSHLSRAYRWRFQLEPMGYDIKISNSIMAVFSAYLLNYTLPRAGEVARASILTNYEGVPFEKAVGTIVAERIADLFMMICVIIATLFLEFDFISNFLIKTWNPVHIVLGGFILILLAWRGMVIIKKSHTKIALKIKHFIKGLLEGASGIFKMKKKWPFIFHTLFIWTLYVLMFYVTSFSLEQTSHVSLAAILVGFIAASFSIATTNGGTGSYPEAIVLVFLLFEIPEDASRAFGWIMWTSQTLMIIVMGGLSLICLPLFNRKNLSK